jgi:hypothetical protein
MTSLLYSAAANYTYNVQQSKEQKLYMYLRKANKEQKLYFKNAKKERKLELYNVAGAMFQRIKNRITSRLYISHFYLRDGVAG